MEVAGGGGVPRRPWEVTDLSSPCNLYAIRILAGRHQPLSNDVCMRAVKKLRSGIDSSGIDARKLEVDLRPIMKTDKAMLAIDHVLCTIAKLEAFLDARTLETRLEARDGEWKESVVG